MTDREKFELEMQVRNLRWENAILIKEIKALKKAEKNLKNTIDFLRKELKEKWVVKNSIQRKKFQIGSRKNKRKRKEGKENDRIKHKNIDK